MWWIFASHLPKSARIHHRFQDSSGMWWILALLTPSNHTGITPASVAPKTTVPESLLRAQRPQNLPSTHPAIKGPQIGLYSPTPKSCLTSPNERPS
ncbi:hypothetical protein CYL77_13425 [Corynebacterium glutamicum]|nr:hypothetical protein B7P23_15240 [Corynebacterium glutamicum]AUI02044.1 hypothetical protein CYL77_13425 [Corynebacterium glutamicum]AUI02859.1 hypothetical protein C0I99_01425 [Corynebacterium glutamicum]